MWEQFSITCYEMWVWLKYEVSVHPFLFAGVVIVVVSAWVLFKSEVKGR
jgi:drug/metabolite transporter superfamily protein YnfA